MHENVELLFKKSKSVCYTYLCFTRTQMVRIYNRCKNTDHIPEITAYLMQTQTNNEIIIVLTWNFNLTERCRTD